jgi:hypothetical protein
MARGRLENAFRAVMRLQQEEHLRAQLGVVAGRAVEVGHLFIGGEIEKGVEHRVDAAVAIGWG